jgi:hypothetical protein
MRLDLLCHDAPPEASHPTDNPAAEKSRLSQGITRFNEFSCLSDASRSCNGTNTCCDQNPTQM